MSTSVGSIHYDLSLDTKKFDTEVTNVQNKISTLSSKMQSAGSAIANSSVRTAAGIAALTAVFSPFIDDAVRRSDTLNNFPKVMKNMGISTEDASEASKILVDKLKGLPTALDTATLGVQRLTTKTGDVKKSTDIFLAFNNAVLAGGAPMELQATATEQFAQAFAKGKPDMMEWRSILAVMPAQLQQVAKAMDLSSVDELGEKLRDGTITMEEFSDKLIMLNSKGEGGLPGLEEQARNATSGIGTSIQNAKTAITRGITDIISAIGASNIAEVISGIGDKIERVFKFIADNIGPVAVFIGTILATAFGILAVKVALATWPILLLATAITGLFTLYEKFKPQIDGFISKVVTGFQILYGYFSTYILPIFQVLWHFISELLVNAWNRLKEAIEPNIGLIKNVAMVIGGILLVIIGAAVVSFLLVVTTIGLVIAFLAQLISWVGALINWFINLSGTINSFTKNIGSWLVGAGKSLIQGLVNGITSMASLIWSGMSTTLDGIGRFVSGIGSWLVNAGKSLIQGLVNGITSMASAPANAVKGVLDKARNLLPFSPAKEGPFSGKGWTLYSGKSIMEGLATGINDNARLPSEALYNALANSSINVNQSPPNSSTINNSINGIVINSPSNADYLLRRLGMDDEAYQIGLVPGGAI